MPILMSDGAFAGATAPATGRNLPQALAGMPIERARSFGAVMDDALRNASPDTVAVVAETVVPDPQDTVPADDPAADRTADDPDADAPPPVPQAEGAIPAPNRHFGPPVGVSGDDRVTPMLAGGTVAMAKQTGPQIPVPVPDVAGKATPRPDGAQSAPMRDHAAQIIMPAKPAFAARPTATVADPAPLAETARSRTVGAAHAPTDAAQISPPPRPASAEGVVLQNAMQTPAAPSVHTSAFEAQSRVPAPQPNTASQDETAAQTAITQTIPKVASAPHAARIPGEVAASLATKPEPEPAQTAAPPQEASAAKPPQSQREKPASGDRTTSTPAVHTDASQVAKPVQTPPAGDTLTDDRQALFGSTPALDGTIIAPRSERPLGAPHLHTPEVAKAVSQQVAVAVTQKPDGQTEIRLNPEELGRVRLALSPSENGITLTITTERPETADLMRRNLEGLAQEFRALGYADVAFDFGQTEDQPAQDEHGSGDQPAANTRPTEPPQDAPAAQPQPTAGLDLRL
ncbi:flagellar hook-length control protein FliK [Octadecabacter sp. R77987]|uniref:flagellar hook-length control protein FliK n=1 Tax=Octadecabacter sp. R77987 TaxID=3093874 RepID=UPI003670D785